ncbi:hypothetical protein, partial [Planktothrix agardhii]|uniref:hypothetical protein n=1 Tax=Planktothrix agardhii TaxID=1160 RepID=UPI00334280E0
MGHFEDFNLEKSNRRIGEKYHKLTLPRQAHALDGGFLFHRRMLFSQDLRKHAIYSVLKVGDRIPMIIAITLKSPDYSFKNKPKRIKQVPF